MARTVCAVAAVGRRLLAIAALCSAVSAILGGTAATSASASPSFQSNDTSVFLWQKEFRRYPAPLWGLQS